MAVGTLAGILAVRLPGYMVAGCRATGIPVTRFLRRAVVPNILPAAASAGVLLALRPVAHNSAPLLVVATLAGFATYLSIYFALGATPGERLRAMAFVTRPLPARWRRPAVPMSTVAGEEGP